MIRRDEVDDLADPVPKATNSALGGLPEVCLDLRDGFLDRVEVGV